MAKLYPSLWAKLHGKTTLLLSAITTIDIISLSQSIMNVGMEHVHRHIVAKSILKYKSIQKNHCKVWRNGDTKAKNK